MPRLFATLTSKLFAMSRLKSLRPNHEFTQILKMTDVLRPFAKTFVFAFT